MRPATAPVKKAVSIKTKDNLGPKIRAGKSTNFTSPNPIPLPLVKRWIINKKEDTRKAVNKF